jgi:hypothetical protein
LNPLTRRKRSRSRCAALAFALLLLPAAGAEGAERPDAGFTASPAEPRAGEAVSFGSTSCDPDGRLVTQNWDLDGDGAFDDASGPSATWTFPAAGTQSVGLRVRSADGAEATERRNVVVDSAYAIPQPPSARLMSPFPVVRLAGRLTGTGARIRLLAVRAPVCAVVEVSCSGPSCRRARRATAFAGRGRVRFRRFERRLRKGTVLVVRIRKGDLVGKYTRFGIREGRPPRRRDLCLRPGERRGTRCPQD